MTIKRQVIQRSWFQLATLVLLIPATVLVVTRARAHVEPITSVTVVVREIVTGGDGTQHVASVQTIAYRSDGTMARRLGPVGKGQRTILRPDGSHITIDDVLKKKSTLYEGAGPSFRSPAFDCVRTRAGEPAQRPIEAVEGREQISGYRVIHARSSGGVSKWYALDYSCVPIKTRFDFGEQGQSETELLSLASGEPSSELVGVPSDYEEGPPSALLPVSVRPGCDEKCQESGRRHRALIDAEYDRKREPKK